MIKAVICDDEMATWQIIKHFLDAEKMPVEIVGCARDGKEALNLIKQIHPQLIFLDINMPYLNGFQVAEQLQDLVNSKIIVITAFASFQNAQQALRIGVSDILPKPIEFEQLKSAIERAIGWNLTANETVNAMLEYIHTHYKEEIGLEALTQITYSTESHLSRLFKKYMDTTILTYVHKLRVEEACRLLRSRKCDIQDAASQVGYSSLNNFYKYFKRFTGTTPAQFTE